MEPITTIIFRLLVTFILSLGFGIERQKSHKPVGFGTFMFVSVGGCALGLIASFHEFANPNPVALLSAVVTGIGFLGAGALIKGTDRVFGFTTASAIWLLAIFGLIIGIGEYVMGGMIYLLIWTTVAFDMFLERRGIGSYQRRLTIVTNRIIKEKDVNKHLSIFTKKHKTLSAEVHKETNNMSLVYLVEGRSEDLNKLVTSLYDEEWLKSSKIE